MKSVQTESIEHETDKISQLKKEIVSAKERNSQLEKMLANKEKIIAETVAERDSLEKKVKSILMVEL